MVWSFPQLLLSLAASDDRSALRRCVDHLPMRLVAQPGIDDAADDAADQRRERGTPQRPRPLALASRCRRELSGCRAH